MEALRGGPQQGHETTGPSSCLGSPVSQRLDAPENQRDTPVGQARRLLEVQPPGRNQTVIGVTNYASPGAETTSKDTVVPKVPQEWC